jgi:hypothetical protein
VYYEKGMDAIFCDCLAKLSELRQGERFDIKWYPFGFVGDYPQTISGHTHIAHVARLECQHMTQFPQ